MNFFCCKNLLHIFPKTVSTVRVDVRLSVWNCLLTKISLLNQTFLSLFFRKIQIDGHSSLPKSYAVKVFEFLAWFSQSRFYSWSENDSFSSFFHTNKFLYHYRISFPFRIPSFDSSFQVANRIIVHLVASFVCY